MSETVCYLVFLKRGRKKALLTKPGGVLFSDRDAIGVALRALMAEGKWKGFEIKYAYRNGNENIPTLLRHVEVASP